jgi:Uncharacterized conserved protein (DUF2075)
VTARLAISGSAGTGKTVCAWYRCDYLTQQGHRVGFVCPNESSLAVSKRALSSLPSGADAPGYLIPRDGHSLAQLPDIVDHVIIDEAQELPATWIRELGLRMGDTASGLTLFFDLNQLGGNVQRGDTSRFKGKLERWEKMIREFPRLQRSSLQVNFRNSREIAQYYHDLLSQALPTPVVGGIPAFEAGKVVIQSVSTSDIVGALSRTLRDLLKEAAPDQIGLAIVRKVAHSEALVPQLKALGLPVTDRIDDAGVFIGSADIYRGHERRAMIVLTPERSRLVSDLGWAVDAYIALSRAIAQLLVLEVR